MRRADRLFDIIQVLRTAARPVTAAVLAERLEVTARTIYRDIADLQASRVPIEGAPGVGYVLRRGFDLPPLMFTSEEIDAIAVGARLVRRLKDAKLQAAAERVLGKFDRCRAAGFARAPCRDALLRLGRQRAGGFGRRFCRIAAARSTTPAKSRSPMPTKRAGAPGARSGRWRWPIMSM